MTTPAPFLPPGPERAFDAVVFDFGGVLITPITDLAVKEKDLVAATQGRGYWILDDLTVLHQATDDTENASVHLYAPRAGYRLTAGSRSDDPGAAGTNPHVGVVFHYSLADQPADD